MLVRHELDTDYYSSEGINQSLLKAVMSDVFSFERSENLYYEEKTHFLVGSFSDDLMFQTDKYIDDNYVIMGSEVQRPSATILSILHQVKDNNWARLPLADCKVKLQAACDDHNYHIKRRKDVVEEDTRVISIINDYSNYFDLINKEDNVTILNEDEFNLSTAMVTALQSSKFTKEVFQFDDPNRIFIPQFPFYWERDGMSCKGLPDLIIIDLKLKIIFYMI
jgi:hypothetical protein